MRRRLLKSTICGVLSLAMVVTAGNFSNVTKAADGDNFTEILDTADKITYRATLEEKDAPSNIGDAHEITLADGTKMTIKDNGTMRTELTSLDLADKYMGTGTNLGNTLEGTLSIDEKKTVIAGNDRNPYDSAWQSGVHVTRELINSMHSYGFNTIRIPVAWSNGDKDDGTYTIDPKLFAKVQEVVNYALDLGMYVVVNDHWDNQWWGGFGAVKYVYKESGEAVPQDKLIEEVAADQKRKASERILEKVADEELRAETMKRYIAYWTQISEQFKGYSDHLILESANEELGSRLNDDIVISQDKYHGYVLPETESKKDFVVAGGNLTTPEQYRIANTINQKFVEIVRASGGNNESRHLLIAGINTNIDDTAKAGEALNENKVKEAYEFKMPTDPMNDDTAKKLFVSVHYYTPWDFCGDGGTGTYTTTSRAEMKKFLEPLKKFNDQGYAVIMGEGGICNPGGVQSSVTQWFEDTLTEAAKYHAVLCMWDTGAYFNRKTGEINYIDIAKYFNIVNGSSGDETKTTKQTGSDGSQSGGEPSKADDGIDTDLWATAGIHAYVTFQMAGTYDYRDMYAPYRNLVANKHSWDHITANTKNLEVQDVQITHNGEYTVSVKGVNLSNAKSFNWLGISTDARRKGGTKYKSYEGLTATVKSVKFDGEEMDLATPNLPIKEDWAYYSFMVANAYDKDGEASLWANYPLGTDNYDQVLPIPEYSIEITFDIQGLDTILDDIKAGTFYDEEYGMSIKEVKEAGGKIGWPEGFNPDSVTPDPVKPTPTPDNGGVVGPAKGQSFATGDFAYKVTKSATTKANGEVEVTGIGTKGATKIALSLGDVVEFSKGKFTVTSIADGAFKNAAKLKSIKINSKSVKRIPANAFSGCKKLSTVTAKYITEIKGSAFKSCKALAKITLGKKLTSVAKNAFKGCKKKISVKGGSKKVKKANIKKLKKSGYKKFK